MQDIGVPSALDSLAAFSRTGDTFEEILEGKELAKAMVDASIGAQAMALIGIHYELEKMNRTFREIGLNLKRIQQELKYGNKAR